MSETAQQRVSTEGPMKVSPNRAPNNNADINGNLQFISETDNDDVFFSPVRNDSLRVRLFRRISGKKNRKEEDLAQLKTEVQMVIDPPITAVAQPPISSQLQDEHQIPLQQLCRKLGVLDVSIVSRIEAKIELYE